MIGPNDIGPFGEAMSKKCVRCEKTPFKCSCASMDAVVEEFQAAFAKTYPGCRSESRQIDAVIRFVMGKIWDGRHL